jgi:hypothetical protein
VSALGADGFTVNWTTAAGSAGSLIHFFALGGDVTARVGDFLANTSTGNQSVTGVTFKPKGLMFLDAGWTTSDTSADDSWGSSGIGFVGSDGSVGSVATDSEDAANPANTARYQRINKCITRISAQGASVRHEAEFVSYDADGFTINWTTVDATQAGLGGRVPYLALAECTMQVGALSSPTTAGQVSTATVANPVGLLVVSAGAAASTSIQNQNRLSVGGSDGTRQAASMIGDEDNITATRGMRFHGSTSVLRMYDTVAADGATSTLTAEAEAVSFSADTFTLDWTTVASTARQVVFAVFAQGASIVEGGDAGPLSDEQQASAFSLALFEVISTHFPTETFLQHIRQQKEMYFVAQEFEHFYSQLQGYLLVQHTQTGAHKNLTAETLSSRGAIREFGRDMPLGVWRNVAFAAGTFTGNAAMTWTVALADQLVYRYMLVGKTAAIAFDIDDTTVGGTPNVSLQLTLPVASAYAASGSFVYDDNAGGDRVGVFTLAAEATLLRLFKSDGSNWTASTNATRVRGQLLVEIA